MPLKPPEEEDEVPKWRQISLEQLSEKMDGQHKRMGGYIQGLRDAQSDTVRVVLETMSKQFVTTQQMDYELEVLEERYGWIPKLLKWVGVGAGGGMLAALLRQILK